MSTFEPARLIERKRDGGELHAEELRTFVDAALRGEVGDAQLAALLMAGTIRGFTTAEAVALTDVLLHSGAQVDLGGLPGPTVDKHSTGGVGDTTTLVVTPLLASLGCQVAKLSGRGLGHTGGTLDKLESIPGMRVELTVDELRAQVGEIGMALAAASDDLVPADKRLYALRDVTGTVPSPALIASSVMSKKLAGGVEHVVLDVKTGDGAFLTDLEQATELAQLCVDIGEAHGRRTGALVTDMSQPLGDAIGNALEVAFAVETLQGGHTGRFRDLCVELAAAALVLAGTAPEDDARAQARARLDDGSALAAFERLVVAQGGDPRVATDPWAVLDTAPVVRTWVPGAGHVRHLACRRLGELAGALGAGRQRAGDPVDHAVGLEVLVRVGDRLDGASPAVRVHARDEAAAQRVLDELDDAVVVGPEPAEGPPLVHRRVGLPA